MERYTCRSDEITLFANNSFSLNKIFSLVAKRTFTQSFIHLGHTLSLYLNDIQISPILKDITTADDIKTFLREKKITLDKLQIIDAEDLKVELDNNIHGIAQEGLTQSSLVKFLGNKDLLNLEAQLEHNDPPAELTIHYQFVVDRKSVKKSGKKKIAEAAATFNAATTPNDTADPEQLQKWIDKQVALAIKIFSEVRQSFKNEEFLDLTDKERLQMYQNRYSNFNRQHPLCIRYMIDMQQFRVKAFTKYMKKVSESQGGDPDVYLQRQADYVTLLWKEITPKWHAKMAKKVWEDAYALVKSESDAFKSMQDTAEDISDKIDSRYENEMKAELAAQLEELRKNENWEDTIIKSGRELELRKAIDGDISDSSSEPSIDWNAGADIDQRFTIGLDE